MSPANKRLLVGAIAKAIARFEGFYNAGRPTVAKRFNNPGNIRRWGSTPVWMSAPDRPATDAERKAGKGYAKFETLEAGQRALEKQIEKNVFERGLTFFEFFAGKPDVYGGYAPSGDNNHPSHYAQYVCEHVNKALANKCAWPADPDTVIRELFDGADGFGRCVR